MFDEFFKKTKNKKTDKPSIVCIGSSSKDIFFPISDGEIFNTPDDVFSQRKIAFELGAKYQSADRFESLGGCAANVAVGLARLGEDVSCYTKVGGDHFGDWIRSELEKNGVKTDLVMMERDCKSDLSSIIVDSGSGERIIFSNRDANERLEVDEKFIARNDWVFISSLNGNWENNLKKIADICQKKSVKIAFNPGQKNIKTNTKLVRDMMSKCEIAVINKDEAIEIISSVNHGIEKEKLNEEGFILEKMSEICKKDFVVTDGQRGAWFVSGKDFFHAPAMIAHAVDSTGAGDSFTSAFIAGYLKKKSLAECVKMGIINSSSVVRHFGAIEGLLDKNAISEHLEKIKIEKIN